MSHFTEQIFDNSLPGLLGAVRLYDLVLSPINGIQYLLDIDNALSVRNTYVVQPNDLPESYIAIL